ncbi:MAG TPA: hypothetical protein VLX68_16695 [Chitinivibrionales bacterium]|nr:hypothetical protein [Chitinivibrionales bacterium]
MNAKNVSAGCLVIFIMVFSNGAIADYVEGLDTTDANGYGLDSAFRVYSDTFFTVKAHILCYEGIWFCNSFDDENLAPQIYSYYDSFFGGTKFPVSYHNFILKKVDSTFCKVQLAGRISGNQYIFRYGKNTTPNDRMLERPDYDRSIRYKPNNFVHNSFKPDLTFDSLLWDPPLPNDNHLVGYIFYCSKYGVPIDTTKPIDLSQWDSVAFISSTKFSPQLNVEYFGNGFFLNLAAVYTEGKSDFLEGWFYFYTTAVGVQNRVTGSREFQYKLAVAKNCSGFAFNVYPSIANGSSASFSIFSPAGRQLARFTDINSSANVWNPFAQHLGPGLYIVKAELPDRTVLTRPFIYTK